ncbi:MAG: hypothetical protein RI922_2000 [Bacteroidota bacterium]|jgi:hypothetical protein
MKICGYFSFLMLIVYLIACSPQQKKVAPMAMREKGTQIYSSKGNTAVIQGDWKLLDIDFSAYYSTLSSETRARLERGMEAQLEMIEGKSFYHFGRNNDLMIESLSEEGEMMQSEGSFKFSAQQDSIYFILDSDVESYRIQVFNENKLVLTTTDTPDRTLTLLKSK